MWLEGLLGLRAAVDAVVFSSRIKAKRSAKRWPEALRVLQEACAQQFGNLIVHNAALSTLSTVSWLLSLVLLDTLAVNSLEGDIITYTSTINACGWPFACALLEEVRKRGLQENVVSCSSAIRCSLWGRSYLLKARQNGLEPNLVCFSALLNSCDWISAINLLRTLRGSSLRSNRILLNSAMKSFTWGHGLEFCQTLRHRSLQPDDFSFNSLIKATCRWPSSLESLRHMAHLKIRRDSLSYSSSKWHMMLEEMSFRQIRLAVRILGSVLDELASNSALWTRSLSLLDEDIADARCYGSVMAKMPWPRALELLQHSYVAAMRACATAGQWQRSLELFKEMSQQALEHSIVCANVAMTACEANWPMALQLLEDLHLWSLEANVVTINVCIKACGERWELATAVATKMSCADETLKSLALCY